MNKTTLFKRGDRVVTRYYDGDSANIYTVIRAEFDKEEEVVFVDTPRGLRVWSAAELRAAPTSSAFRPASPVLQAISRDDTEGLAFCYDFHLMETGGGCTAFVRSDGDCEWILTADDDAGAPGSVHLNCRIGLTDESGDHGFWRRFPNMLQALETWRESAPEIGGPNWRDQFVWS